MSVRVDSTDAAPTSFGAVRSAAAFAERGFVGDSEGVKLYFGPDADVMLDPHFAAAYCFRMREGRRVAEIGLGFSPARAQQGRVDIDGTLWIDTVAKVVSEISFNYLGAGRGTEFVHPGGQINFRAMPNGSVMIDRWFLRMVDSRQDQASGVPGHEEVHTYYYARESGGELAWARWRDGHSWKASLATVRLKVVDGFNDPVTRAVIRLTDTDYLGSPDSTGTVVFNDVLPGPYDVEIQDSALVSKQIAMKAQTHFIADRGRIIVRTIVAPPVYAFFKEACQKGATGKWIEIDAVDNHKHPVQVSWKLGEDLGGRLEHLHATGVTTKDGVFGYCRDNDLQVSLDVWLQRLDDPTKVMTVLLPATPGRKPWVLVMPYRTYASGR